MGALESEYSLKVSIHWRGREGESQKSVSAWRGEGALGSTCMCIHLGGRERIKSVSAWRGEGALESM